MKTRTSNTIKYTSKDKLLMSVLTQIKGHISDTLGEVVEGNYYRHALNNKEYAEIAELEPILWAYKDYIDLGLTAYDVDTPDDKDLIGVNLYLFRDSEDENYLVGYDLTQAVYSDTNKVLYTDGQRLWLRDVTEFYGNKSVGGVTVPRFGYTGKYRYRLGEDTLRKEIENDEGGIQ